MLGNDCSNVESDMLDPFEPTFIFDQRSQCAYWDFVAGVIDIEF